MRYRILECVSPTCTVAGENVRRCVWKCKVLSCLHSNVVNIYETGEHLASGSDAPTGRLTEKDKTVARSLAKLFVKPVRIRNKIADENGGVAPALEKLQNFVTYFWKREMNNTDDTIDLEKMIGSQAYKGTEGESNPFAFSNKTRYDGKFQVGEGTDSDEFLVGYTTKALLRRMDRDERSFIFHVDATFKLSQVDYSTIVCGVSDKARSFHLVALLVASQRTESQYASVFASIKRMYYEVVGKPLVLRYVMGDADDAQFNAVLESFQECNVEYLMCFWHMITKFYEHGKSLTPAKLALAAADVYDMHYAMSESQFHVVKPITVRRWMADPEIAEFGRYFYRQWLSGKFFKWQCFRTQPAFSTTNNPVETFNATIKKNYTLRQRMKMGLLLSQLARCCGHNSLFGPDFSEEAKSTPKVRSRATELRRRKLIEEMPALACTDEDSAENDYVLVRVCETPRIYVRPRKKTVEIIELCPQMGVNNARMERDEQPAAGWAVNVRARICPCKLFFKHVECVHVVKCE